MSYTIGSLFDGSGGFPLAGTLCGIEPRWASEVEPYPIAVTRSRFPKMKHLGDISKINGAEIEPVDVITFGSPCQDLSVAGRQAGLKHESNGDSETTRSGLFIEAVRIIKEMRRATNDKYPKFAIWENVPGAFSSNRGEDFRTVLEEIIQIVEPSAPEIPATEKGGWAYADALVGDGWSVAYRTFDAQYWGVPQRRRRIYLVADFTGECAQQVLFKREGLRRDIGTGGTQAKENTGGNESSVGAKGKFRTFIMSQIGGQGERCNESEINSTLCAGGNAAIAYCLQGNGIGRSETAGCNGKGWREGAIYTLNTVDRPAVVYSIDQGGGKSSATVYKDQTPTLTCTHGGAPAVLQGGDEYIVRRLTPTECARLQGFADEWGHIEQKNEFTDEEYRFWLEVRNTHAKINGKNARDYTEKQMLAWYNKLHSDSAEYKMWGNGIALPPSLYVMQGIADVLNERARP